MFNTNYKYTCENSPSRNTGFWENFIQYIVNFFRQALKDIRRSVK